MKKFNEIRNAMMKAADQNSIEGVRGAAVEAFAVNGSGITATEYDHLFDMSNELITSLRGKYPTI